MNAFDQADQIVSICTGLMPCVVVIVLVICIVIVMRRGNKPSAKTQKTASHQVETRVCSSCGKSFIAAPEMLQEVGQSVRKQFSCPYCKAKVEYLD